MDVSSHSDESARSHAFRALDPRSYLDPDVFEREKERIFFRAWQCAGHVSEIPHAGCYLVKKIVDQEVFVIRRENDEIGGFYNVCMHRAHPLVGGKGRCKSTLSCPYHGWTYYLDGTLCRARHVDRVPDFPAKDIRLSPVRVEVFCGFIFVSLDPEAPLLARQVSHMVADVRRYIPEIENLQFVGEVDLAHRCNWKVTVENYSECYHCRLVHDNDIFKDLDVPTYRIEPNGITASMHCEPRKPGGGRTLTEAEFLLGSYASWYIWPNFSLNWQPGGYIRIGIFEPTALDQTIYRYRYFSDGRFPDHEVLAYMNRHAELTGGEDAELVERVQRGLRSRGYRPGPLVVDGTHHGEREQGVVHFHALLKLALATA